MMKAKACGRLVTCDLICLGVASPGVFSRYIQWLEHTLGTHVLSYTHRGFGERWGDKCELCITEEGKIIINNKYKSWRSICSGVALRPSCYTCAYHSIKRPGDLTIGDFWGINDLFFGEKDSNGVSCVLVNTEIGFITLSSLKSSLKIAKCSVSDVANKAQPMLSVPPPQLSNRDLFWETLYTQGFERALRVIGKKGIVATIRMILGRAKNKIKDSLCKCGEIPSSNTLDWSGDIAASTSHNELPLAFAAKHCDDDVRANSSSGGVFHALAEWVIKEGGVVYGCVFDEGLHARHVRCETIEQCEKCMGAKYSQSDMNDCIHHIEEDLELGRLVLFTGTPCQVDAVKHSCGEF